MAPMHTLPDPQAHAREQLVGTRLNAWELDAVLGEGATAVVYRAHRVPGGSGMDAQIAAVKVLHPEAATNPKIRAALENEGRILMKLRHPGVVRAFDFGVEHGRMYLAQTYINGQTLEEMVTPGLRLGEEAAIDITEAAARTLAALHRQNIVHRDIKPGNILILEGSRRPMLFDLGAAIDLNRDTPEPGEVYGTPAYASPEQARGDAQIDGRADIYSLGITLYRIVAARKPFYGSRLDLLRAQVETLPPFPSEFVYVTPDLEAVIMKALAKDPAERFQDADEMADALRAAKTTIGSSPPPIVSRIRDWMMGPATREV